MNVELSRFAVKLLNDLYRTGLFGASPEDTARQFVEEGLRKYSTDLIRAKRATSLPQRRRALP